MKIIIKPTETFVDLADMGNKQSGPARIWSGVTDEGVPVVVLVALLASTLESDFADLKALDEGSHPLVSAALLKEASS